MKFGTTFYLSRVIGNTVHSAGNQSIGKLHDIVVDLNAIRPKVIAAVVKIKRKEIFVIDFSCFSITKVNAQYRIECQEVKEIQIPNHSLFLVKDVLDKQIVDMYGRKVVRVNDLRLAVLSNGTYLVAVDVGFEGFLRRLGIAKPLIRLLKPFNIRVSSNLLLWDEVETIDVSKRGLKLSKTYTKLSTMHPSDLADILEDLDRTSRLEIFSSLDVEKAADVLEELETDAQINVLESLSADEAAHMLTKLSADEVADILVKLGKRRADQILMAMEPHTRDEIRDLMEYPDDSVGSLMTREFVALSSDWSVRDAIGVIRQLKPESDNVHNLYVVNEAGRLQGAVSLRDLVVADPNLPIRDVMNRDPIFVYDNEDIDDLTEKMSKYNLVSIPVVVRNKELIGMVMISDVLDFLMQSKRKRH